MKSIKNQKIAKVAFITTLIAGFVFHMYAISHNFLTYDSMWNLYSPQDMLSSGRHFLQYACMISSYYDLTWINGILAFLYLGLTSVLLVEIFDVKRKSTAVIIAVSLVGFPSITSMFCYSYTRDGYALAILLSVLAVCLTINVKGGVFLGAISLGISMGIYQAYLSIAILLCIFILLIELYETEYKKKIFRLFIKMIGMGLLSYIIYLGSLKLFLLMKSAELSGYQGTNKVFNLDLTSVFFGIKSAYINFKDFLLYGGLLTPTAISKFIIIGISIVGIIEMAFLMHVTRKRYNLFRVALIAIALSLLPIATSTVAILSPETYFHTLLRYPWVMYFVFFIVLAEKLDSIKKVKWLHSLYQIAAILVMTIMFNYFVTANIVYFNMNERYEKTYATSLRIISRIEKLDGYKPNSKIAILGGGLSPDSFEIEEATYAITKEYFGSYGVLCVTDTDKFAEFFSHYFGVTLDTTGLENEMKIADTLEFREMGKFPAEDSIRWIGDILVIKLNG